MDRHRHLDIGPFNVGAHGRTVASIRRFMNFELIICEKRFITIGEFCVRDVKSMIHPTTHTQRFTWKTDRQISK